MRDFQQIMQLFSGMSGMTLIWIQLGMVGLLTSLICWRRQAIIRLGSFRQSFFWLSMSFIIPGALNIMLPLALSYFDFLNMGMGGRNANPFGGLVGIVYGLSHTLPSLLVGISILFLSRAIVPKFIPPELISADDTPLADTPQRPVDTASE